MTVTCCLCRTTFSFFDLVLERYYLSTPVEKQVGSVVSPYRI